MQLLFKRKIDRIIEKVQIHIFFNIIKQRSKFISKMYYFF